MMSNALDLNGAKKVFILGRRLEKLQEVASQAVRQTRPGRIHGQLTDNAAGQRINCCNPVRHGCSGRYHQGR